MAFASSASCPTGHLPRNSCTQTLSSGTICTCHSLRSLAISVTVSSVQIIFQCILMFSWWTILARESGPEGLQCTRSQKSSAPQLYFCGPKIHSNTEVAWHVLKLIFTILFHSFYFYIFFKHVELICMSVFPKIQTLSLGSIHSFTDLHQEHHSGVPRILPAWQAQLRAGAIRYKVSKTN